ncbi:MAG: hypothetical protein M9947_00855 [Thermomicrobiales bacterium]|nr:hypothetical protein [Thermomicrobiales bacterium]
MDRALQAQIDAEPDATLTRTVQAWLATEHAEPSSVVARSFGPWRDWIVPKKSLIATERDPGQRAAWHQDQARLVADDLVFLDETSTQITLTRRHGRSTRGHRLVASGSPQPRTQRHLLARCAQPEWDHPWSSKVRSMDRSLPSGCARSWYRPCDRVRS